MWESLEVGFDREVLVLRCHISPKKAIYWSDHLLLLILKLRNDRGSVLWIGWLKGGMLMRIKRMLVKRGLSLLQRCSSGCREDWLVLRKNIMVDFQQVAC